MSVLIDCNKYNTPITKEFIEEHIPIEEYGESIQKEVLADMTKFVTGIKFIRNLISKDRKRASDLKRYANPFVATNKLKEDPKGRIKVDVSNPHILEDMDYFRQSRLYFEKHGRYCPHRPSSNRLSAFMVFWREERRRCWEGYVRESDGEWISGNNYYYWNYGTIQLAIVDEETGSAERVNGLPSLYDGDYWFYHYMEFARRTGKHASCLKARGLGYSFKAGALLGRNFVLGESERAKRLTNNIALAGEKEYLVKDGVLNKFLETIEFNAEGTPFPNRRDVKNSINDMHWVMSYIDAETGREKGVKNQVMGVTLKDDPEKARGKRSSLIIWEESGKFKDFLTAWGIARPSVEHNGYAFGIMLAFGTGGTKGAAFDGLKEIFYNPKGYNILSIPNVFDLNTHEKNECSFFHSRYLNYQGCMDENGNSDVLKALLLVIKERVIIKYNSKDAGTLPQHIAENPITPQESILQATGNFFPVTEIREYLEHCRVNEQSFVALNKVGYFKLGDSDMDVEFVEDYAKVPIRSYTPKDSSLEGAVEIFVEPYRSTSGNIQSGRYIAGIDPVDADYVLTGSLASIFVYDTFTDSIVAEYTGRPQLAETFYEICRRLLLYYNAIANYENNIKGLFGHFKNKNSLHLLADTPTYLRDSHNIKANIVGNAAKGTRATDSVNKEGLQLQLTWLLTNHITNDGDNEIKVLNLRRIPSLGYLEELLAHNFMGNFDRISAMGMLMIYKKELGNRVIESEEEEFYIEEDEFIKQNFDDVHSLQGIHFDNITLFKP